MKVLHSISVAVQNNNEFDRFGEFVASRLRKLSKVVSEENVDFVETSITNILINARWQSASIPPTASSNQSNSFYTNLLNS